MRLIPIALVSGLALLAPVTGSAQPASTFDDLAPALPVGTKVRIEDRAGARTAGRLAAMTSDEIAIDTRAGERRFPRDAVRSVARVRGGYGRRGALSMWVVPTGEISATTPDDVAPFFDPGNDKPYRHPQFYRVPRGVRGV